MGLIQNVVGWVFKEQLAKLQKEYDKTIGSDIYDAILQNVKNYPVYIPADVNKYITEGYLFNPIVYSVVSTIAQQAANIPWSVYSVKNEKALNLYKAASHDLPYYKKQAFKTKALVELPDHELNTVLVRPNELQTWSEFVEQVIGYKLITGNSYIHAIGPTSGNNAGLIREMWTLPSQLMVIVPGDKMHPVKQYEIIGDRSNPVPAEQVIHVKYWTPLYLNGQFLYGISPIQAGRRVVTRSNSSYDASTSSLQNMGIRGFISAADGSTEYPLTEEQADFLQKRLERLGGPKNAGKVPVTSANLKWNQMGMSPVDLAIIENDKMDLRTICMLYKYPSELMGDSANKTYSNTKEAGSSAYTKAILPNLAQLRNSINAFIKPKYQGQIYVDFDTSMISELQDDLQGMATAMNTCYWLTPNEKRDMMSFDADESNPMMNEYLIPAGLVPMTGDMLSIPDDVLDDELKPKETEENES